VGASSQQAGSRSRVVKTRWTGRTEGLDVPGGEIDRKC